MKSINEANIYKGLRILVRADIDVPIENGIVLEPYRLEQSLPTLKYIIEKQGFPVIIGHIGKGAADRVGRGCQHLGEHPHHRP